MSGPQPSAIEVSAEQRGDLERLVRAGTTAQQLVLRARIVLLAADGQNNTQIGVTLGVPAKTARQWRERWRALAVVPLAELSVTARLADAPRAGAPARLTPEQVCQIIALACEQPADSDRPISQWSARELADEIVRRVSPTASRRAMPRGC